MAEIGTVNPTQPIWPTRPVKPVDRDSKRQQQEQPRKHDNEAEDQPGGSESKIDDYA